MVDNNIKEKTGQKAGIFHQRLDFYWQYIAVYAILLLIYSLIRGTIEQGRFTIVLYDPFVILLFLFIVASAISLLVNYYKARTIIVGSDFIAFRNRFREKKYSIQEISRISLGKEKIIRVRRGAFKVAKISLRNRRKTVKLRPSSFWNEAELIQALIRLKKSINR